MYRIATVTKSSLLCFLQQSGMIRTCSLTRTTEVWKNSLTILSVHAWSLQRPDIGIRLTLVSQRRWRQCSSPPSHSAFAAVGGVGGKWSGASFVASLHATVSPIQELTDVPFATFTLVQCIHIHVHTGRSLAAHTRTPKRMCLCNPNQPGNILVQQLSLHGITGGLEIQGLAVHQFSRLTTAQSAITADSSVSVFTLSIS